MAAGFGLAGAPGKRRGRSANLRSLGWNVDVLALAPDGEWGLGSSRSRVAPNLGEGTIWCRGQARGAAALACAKAPRAWPRPLCLYHRVPVGDSVAGGVPVMVTRTVMVSHPCETQSSVTTLLSPCRHVGPPPAPINPARRCRRGQPGARGAAEGQVWGEDGRWAGVGGWDGGAGGLAGLGGGLSPGVCLGGHSVPLPPGVWLAVCPACTPRSWARARGPAGGAGPHPAAPAPLPSRRLSWPLLSRSHQQPRQTSPEPAPGPGLPVPPPGQPRRGRS